MMLKIYDSTIPESVLRPLSEALREGEIIIIPTDTRYCICCDALNRRALERLAALKGVDPSKSNFSILCAEISQISEYARLSDEAFRLIKDYLPGPFTFILPTGRSLPRIYKGRKEVGVRIPDHPMVEALVRYFGHPITGFSLPLREGWDADEAYMYHPELIAEAWNDIVAHVVDGGVGSLNESTIVDCTVEPFEVIRQGIGTL